MRFGALLVSLFLCSIVLGTANAQTEPVIHVAVSGYEGTAEAYYAQDLGLFKAAGLNVQIQQLNGTAAIVAAEAGGSLQIGAGTPIALANAKERGIDVVIIGPGALYDAALPLVAGLVVAPNSSVAGAKDLNGKTIAIDALRSFNQLSIETWVDRHGGDSKTVKWLEIGNGAMNDMVASGRADAAGVNDPFFTAGTLAGKTRLLSDPYAAIAPRYMVGCWFAMRSWADANPDTVRKFAAAENAGAAWAVKNPEAAALVLQKYLKVTVPRAREYHTRTLDPALLQPLFDAAVKYGVLDKPLDARTIIWR